MMLSWFSRRTPVRTPCCVGRWARVVPVCAIALLADSTLAQINPEEEAQQLTSQAEALLDDIFASVSFAAVDGQPGTWQVTAIGETTEHGIGAFDAMGVFEVPSDTNTLTEPAFSTSLFPDFESPTQVEHLATSLGTALASIEGGVQQVEATMEIDAPLTETVDFTFPEELHAVFPTTWTTTMPGPVHVVGPAGQLMSFSDSIEALAKVTALSSEDISAWIAGDLAGAEFQQKVLEARSAQLTDAGLSEATAIHVITLRDQHQDDQVFVTEAMDAALDAGELTPEFTQLLMDVAAGSDTAPGAIASQMIEEISITGTVCVSIGIPPIAGVEICVEVTVTGHPDEVAEKLANAMNVVREVLKQQLRFWTEDLIEQIEALLEDLGPILDDIVEHLPPWLRWIFASMDENGGPVIGPLQLEPIGGGDPVQ